MADVEKHTPHFNDEQQKILATLTDEQRDFLAGQRVDHYRRADWIPYSLYRPMMFALPRFTVELALVKPTEDGTPEVLMTQRSPDDEDFSSQWHIPGVGSSNRDRVRHYHDNDDALNRIIADEVGGDLQITDPPSEIGTIRRQFGDRSETTTQYWAKVVGGDQEYGEFFDVNDVLRNPPEGGLVLHHDDTIRKVVAHYLLLQADGR